MSYHAPFTLKRAYMRCLFEVYVNREIDRESGDNNEVISSQEISEVLSKEIIPQLDPKNIYTYLEGLVRVQKGEPKDMIWDMRRQLIKEKSNFFINYKEFKSMA